MDCLFAVQHRVPTSMPANLTQQYLKAEQAYRRAQTPEEELNCLQEMLRELPKHKGTDKLQAELKQKISRAKQDVQTAKSSKKGPSLRIPRQGAGRVVVIGGPNSGKSQLVKALTRAEPEVAPYPFTTHQPAPAMMPHEDIAIQLIDTPPITADVFDPVTQGLIRGADLVWFLVDLGSDDGIEYAQEAFEKLSGTKTRLARTSYLSDTDVGLSYTAAYLVFTKMDDASAPDRLEVFREFCDFDLPEFFVSGESGDGLEALRQATFEHLDVVRVYTKMPNEKEPDFDKPFTIRRGGTLLEVAQLIHKDMAATFKFAKVWGSQVHAGATMKGDYVLADKDIVEIHAG